MFETQELVVASSLAAKAHAGQLRKYTNQPYIVHPDDVVQRLKLAGAPQVVQIAGYWHDVPEDVKAKDLNGRMTLEHPVWNLRLIVAVHGPEVGQLVSEVTNVFTKQAYPDLRREERHLLEIDRLSRISNDGKGLKLADVLSNTDGIVAQDPKFAAKYLAEKWELLQKLTPGIQAGSWQMALFNKATQQLLAQKELLQKLPWNFPK